MKVPYNWLSELVADAPDVETAATLLTFSGTNVEEITQVGVHDASGENGSHFRIAQVISFEQHPDADRLRLVKVNDGGAEPRQIVCGATNFEAGDKVALVTPGGVMPDGMKIKPAKLRGVESFGMLMSERELGLSTEHAGIMILNELTDAKPGDLLNDHLPLGDAVLELEITGNRPDCMGVLGVARELAAANKSQLLSRDLDQSFKSDDTASATDVQSMVSVKIEATDLCGRYMARGFDSVQVAPSPKWLVARLARAGMRAINNVVDITNYVMLLTGQPLHAFDADAIGGNKIIVRRAHEDEPVTTLDDVERVLDSDMLVIADADKPMVIAGIMGAADVEVNAGTTRIILEAASFDKLAIQRASRMLALRSESSARFEKGIDQHSPETALNLATSMLTELCGAKLTNGTIDERAQQNLPEQPVIELTKTTPKRILGIDIPDVEIAESLSDLGYKLEDQGEIWKVTVPTWRMTDTTREIDLVEEIGRFRLNEVPSTLPAIATGGAMLSPQQRLRRLLEDSAAGMGLNEVITYGLVAPKTGERLGVDSSDVLHLANPLTVDHAELRTSLVPSHLEVIKRNALAGNRDVTIFEYGRTFLAPTAEGKTGDDGLPRFAQERDVFAVTLTGEWAGKRWDRPGIELDIEAAIGIVTALCSSVGVEAELSKLPNPPEWMHPGRAATISDQHGRVIGWIATIHPTFAKEYGVEGETHAFMLDVEYLAASSNSTKRFTPFSEYPAIVEDIALILKDDVSAASVLKTAQTAGGELLEAVTVFDRYAGAPIDDGSHSLALRLTYRSTEQTLKDADVLPVRNAVVDALAKQHGAVLRDS